MSEIHSVVFLTPYWDTKDARKWLASHDLKPIKKVHKVVVDDRITQLRYRIRDPQMFSRFITKALPNHINLVIGFE